MVYVPLPPHYTDGHVSLLTIAQHHKQWSSSNLVVNGNWHVDLTQVTINQ